MPQCSLQYYQVLTLFSMGGGVGGGATKRPPNSFSPVTSTNVRINPQNLLTFSLNPNVLKFLV